MTGRARRRLRVGAVALPGVALAAAGLAHPPRLDSSTAVVWWQYHVVLLPLFPLLAVAVWMLLRGVPGPVATVARIAAYGYAVFYTALDLLAGVAAGRVVESVGRANQAALDVGGLGVQLGAVGEWALVVATALTGVVLVRRDGRRAVPGAVLAVGAAVAFVGAHVYWPTGGLAMLGFAAGCALLAASAPAERTVVAR
jgi:hypothetical protein